MTFSVIIPVYNVENYLHECVDSIVNQTCQDFELILIDNGSTDNSGKICDEYAAKYPNVRVKHLMPNIMASGARNEGQALAKGDYILFIDSDDYYIDNKVFEKLKEKTLNNPDVVLFNHVDFFEKTGTFGKKLYNMDVVTEGRPAVDICNELIDKDSYYNSAWSKAIKRSILEDNDIHFTPGLTVEDNDWYFRVVLHLKSIAIVNEPVYVYRRRTSGSITSSGTIKNIIDCLNVIEKWLGIIEKEKSNPNSEIILHSLSKQYCNYLIGYSSQSRDKNCDRRFKQYSFLLNHTNTPRVVTFRKVYRLFGLNGILWMLKVYKKVR